ncbi:STAS domain-containing protein [Streptomyces chartreusis]|uniref:STAS domain-containing protein n=1 Tax=Streptomyces chartreusis TaxID=1969 RepID=UPI002E19BCA6
MPDLPRSQALRLGRRLPRRTRRRSQVERRSASDRVAVRLSGEITSANAARIGQHLQGELRSRPAILEVNLQDVTCLGSDGGVLFFMALHTAREHRTRIIVTHVRSQVRQILSQLGLERVLDMYEGEGPPPRRDDV